MPRYWANTFLGYTAVVTGGTQADFPVTNIISITETPQQESYRSDDTGVRTITVDFGAVKNVAAFALWNYNKTSITIDGVGYTVAQSERSGRYCHAKDVSINKQSFDVVIPSGTPVDGAAYNELGQLLFIENGQLKTFPGFEQFGTDYDPTRPMHRAGKSKVRLNEHIVRTENWDILADESVAAQVASISEIARLGEDEPVVTWADYEAQEVLLAQLQASIQPTLNAGHRAASLTWREMV